MNTLSAEFKKIAQDLVTLGYSHAEQLVEDCKDPSHAVQVLLLIGPPHSVLIRPLAGML